MAWVKAKVDKFFKRRKENPKKDMVFLTPQLRARRICNDANSANSFLSTLYSKAERYHQQEKRLFIVLDVEIAQDQGFSWHEKELRLNGVKREEMERRKANHGLCLESSDRKKPAAKVFKYWDHKKEDWQEGIADGAVAAISMAAVSDYEGDDVFSINCVSVVAENNGQPRMPPKLESLLSHPAAYFINVNQYDDLDKIIGSFFRCQIDGIKFVEAGDFFASAWDESWRYASVLNIVEHAFIGSTYFKSPALTMSNWATKNWSPAQQRYALEDVFFLARAINLAMDSVKDSTIKRLIYDFPDKSLGVKERNRLNELKGGAPSSSSSHHKKTTADDGEPFYWPAMAENDYGFEGASNYSLHPNVRVDADGNISIGEDDSEDDEIITVDPAKSSRLVFSRTPPPKDPSPPAKSPSPPPKSPSPPPKEPSPAPSSSSSASSASSSPSPPPYERPQPNRIVARKAPPPPAPLRARKRPLQMPDEYVVVSEVETIPTEDEEAMEAEAEPIAPAVTTHGFVETTLTWSTQIDLGAAKKSRIEELPPSGLILSTPKPIKLRPISPATRRVKDLIRLAQVENGKQVLYERFCDTPEELRPETLGLLTTAAKVTNGFKENIRYLMDQFAPLFSYEEKRRLIFQAASRPSHWEIVDIMEMVNWTEFDVYWVATQKAEAAWRCFERFDGDVAALKEQMASWLKFGQLDILPLLRQSPFSTQVTEAQALSVFHRDSVDFALRLLCNSKKVMLPKEVPVAAFSFAMAQFVNAYARGEMNGGVVVKWVKAMVDLEPRLKELALVCSRKAPLVQEAVEKVLDDPDASLYFPWCDCPNKPSKSLQIFQIGADISVDDATAALITTDGHVALSYRPTNDPRYVTSMGILVWQIKGKHNIYVLNCLNELSGEERRLVATLYKRKILMCNAGDFYNASMSTFGFHPRNVLPPRRNKRVTFFVNYAQKNKRPFCKITRYCFLRDDADLDATLRWHMATEVDFLNAHMNG